MSSADARPAEVSSESAPPRESKGERTRRRILDAARGQFGRYGFERATIRGIAQAAEVDKASVIQYFGSKQKLFREAVTWPAPPAELAETDAAHAAENYLGALLGTWAADPDSPVSVLLRASMTSEEAAGLLREHVTQQAVDPVAERIEGPDARLRAAVFGAVTMGIATQRYLLGMPDLAEAPLEDVLRIATPVLRQLLDPEATAPEATAPETTAPDTTDEDANS
ncbi:TetR/AcrR family transcriptional regulator [Streptomyces sp. NA04227]|uniref:TetR/AcrR family transcriptional regulator n=1 Tax=Streptomyces sp. NA04227 TaxID=2742136 RepID=UPI001592482D|nr:TetR family transcriptional regulator [Streptomyces sp. NA04227]QKW07311.1 TetR/AcrR family transcriptional regulator [Streptomyces sp. NA04227]